jgi:hypothetical protein
VTDPPQSQQCKAVFDRELDYLPIFDERPELRKCARDFESAAGALPAIEGYGYKICPLQRMFIDVQEMFDGEPSEDFDSGKAVDLVESWRGIDDCAHSREVWELA